MTSRHEFIRIDECYQLESGRYFVSVGTRAVYAAVFDSLHWVWEGARIKPSHILAYSGELVHVPELLMPYPWCDTDTG